MSMSPESVRWVLSEAQRARAIHEADRRRRVDQERGRAPRNGCPAEGREARRIDLLGAAGEMAVACYLGMEHLVYAEAEARRGSFDLPPNLDVKTAARHHYTLLCFADERPDKVMVLVTIERREIQLRGWILAADAKQPRWWREPKPGRGCYCVPQSALHPMRDLLARARETSRRAAV